MKFAFVEMEPTVVIDDSSFYEIHTILWKMKNDCMFCSNALPFNLVHFLKGEYPGKLT